MAVGKTVTGSRKREALTDFEANLLAAWQNLERVYQEAQRLIKRAAKERRRDSERRKREKAKLSLETSVGEQKRGTSETGSSKRIKEIGISGSSKSSKRKRKFSDVDEKSVGFSSIFEEEEGEEVFEPPTMSFEEHLTYDQPQKKKKAVKPSLSAGEEDQWHSPCLLCHPSLNSSCASHQSPSQKRTKEKRAAQEPPEAPQPKRILLDADIKLPDIPLPPIQASCSPLPAVEAITCSHKKSRAVASPAEETEGGFTGRRLNSKTPVFSGSKPAQRVPQTMTPSQQSVPDLNKNVDGRVAKIVFLDSPPKAPRDIGRRPETSGTGGALLPEKTINCALDGQVYSRLQKEVL
ncbi:elongin-A-like [Numenius arquata]|uniref:elongin-A-like n=1 Tax=Numenius arquata TaxID=31919 RepID=UPI003D30C750